MSFFSIFFCNFCLSTAIFSNHFTSKAPEMLYEELKIEEKESIDSAVFDSWSDLDEQKLEEMRNICNAFGFSLTDPCILVNVNTQKLHLISSKGLICSYPVSTAKNGVGQVKDSWQTPLGLHFIAEKIGDGADPFAVFKGRRLTGEIVEANKGGSFIIGRILWLHGVQSGFNQGTDLEGNIVDSYSRYIYIHGTNNIANIGQPASAGCINMKPFDVIDLFDKIPEGVLLYIYKV